MQVVAGRRGARTRRRAVQFSPKLGGELPGVRDYMLQYPYRCFEQVTSRSIALHDEAMWKAALETAGASGCRWPGQILLLMRAATR
jgi:uncharacterized protein YfaS (alpha-2-macroglobulin family)